MKDRFRQREADEQEIEKGIQTIQKFVIMKDRFRQREADEQEIEKGIQTIPASLMLYIVDSRKDTYSRGYPVFLRIKRKMQKVVAR
ncbi:hypothetical protein QE152_g3782 [Popillia japonica]|uniref:Uncharacterized protein n=1 Tax=Popillia japonica TaxID=7064 RepID=A0AAW1N4Y0_POPJA